MSKPIFATLRTADGVENSRLFLGWDEYNDATFSPWVEVVGCIPLFVHGKTYAERKQSARDLAMDVQCADVGGLSYAETYLMCDYFTRMGQRYGLTEEFEENGVI